LSAFFFAKKKQKTFVGLSRTQWTKVFWSFFAKKDCLQRSVNPPRFGPRPIHVRRIAKETQMRLLPSFAVLMLMTTASLAQPAPDMSQQGPGPDQNQPMAPQGGYGQPQGGPMQAGARHAPMFDMANVTHDGRLTRDQAQAGGMIHIAQHFDQIDAEHKGYVTKQDIRAWRQAKKAAKQAQMQQQPPAPQQ
jgi:hypothetical protein